MKPRFHPRLINDLFSDPGLYIPFLFEKRALMFDLGDISALSPKDLLKVTHVFVTHTHMDHFIGFDVLLRILLGRSTTLSIYGPHGFINNVEGKLAAYTWNLVEEYEADLKIIVNEVDSSGVVAKTYNCRRQFQPEGPVFSREFTGKVLEEPSFSIRVALLDHRIPCLGLSMKETFHVNIIKEGLREMGLPVGSWLNRFKAELYKGASPEKEFQVTWGQGGRITGEKTFQIGELKEKIASISKGQKIAYITDAIASQENRTKIAELAKGADILFIESPFLSSEKDMARRKFHLTAQEAGEIAGDAGVRELRLFHLSPRQKGRQKDIEKEAMKFYKGTLQKKGFPIRGHL